MECTWRDCKNKANYPQLDKNGNTWANLCSEHHEELEKVFGLMADNPVHDNIKKMIAIWIKANGGTQVMAAKSTIPKKASELFGKLLKLKKRRISVGVVTIREMPIRFMMVYTSELPELFNGVCII